jgi:hypothetical protein
MSILGLDHGVGHPLLFLGKAKEHKYRNSKDLKNLDNYPEWPKVADAAIETEIYYTQFTLVGNKFILHQINQHFGAGVGLEGG